MHDLGASTPATPRRLTVGYVGGGSRGWARTLMNDLAQCTDLAGEVRLYDVDTGAARENARLASRIQDHEDAVGDWEYTVAETLADALAGADFVVCSTQDPPAETFAHDLSIPEEYGIYQSVGDTVGPGGAMRAMRAVPQYREIAAAVREHCPDAWVINYTNPMSVCTRTLYEEYPAINAVGLCHEVFFTQAYLADLLAEYRGVDAAREDVDVDVSGVNHFTWLTGARFRGEDLWPLIERRSEELGELPAHEPGELADEPTGVDSFHVTFDLYRRFGAFPAAGDRHLAEFVPWYLDIDAPEEVHRWGIRLTRAEHRVDYWPEEERERERYRSGEADWEFEDSGEEIVDIFRALCGIAPLKTNVNLPNRGQAPGLPAGAVVETNGLFTGDSLTPLTADPLPDAAASLVRRHADNQETLVAAGFEGDVDRAYRAFLSDPLVNCDAERARALFRELVAAERPYLEDWDLADSEVL
ncbi:MAG: glycoside hydrolase family 4 [Halobacteriaceae archaeon]